MFREILWSRVGAAGFGQKSRPDVSSKSGSPLHSGLMNARVRCEGVIQRAAGVPVFNARWPLSERFLLRSAFQAIGRACWPVGQLDGEFVLFQSLRRRRSQAPVQTRYCVLASASVDQRDHAALILGSAACAGTYWSVRRYVLTRRGNAKAVRLHAVR